MDRKDEPIIGNTPTPSEPSENLSGDETEDIFANHPYREEWLAEIRKRREEYLRGQGSSVTYEEMRAKGRKIIEDAKQRNA